jgi:hypothetical protein
MERGRKRLDAYRELSSLLLEIRLALRKQGIRDLC